MQAFGQPALTSVDITFTAKYGGQAALALLEQDADDNQDINAN